MDELRADFQKAKDELANVAGLFRGSAFEAFHKALDGFMLQVDARLKALEFQLGPAPKPAAEEKPAA